MEDKIVDVIYAQVGFGGVLLLVLIAAFWKLHSELTQIRVEMAYQMNRDLLAKRFDAYADLWSRMQPTAIYTGSGFGPRDAGALSEKLSEWYFSANGGLFLTSRAREFYFALQELLQSVARLSTWHCKDRPEKPNEVFGRFVAQAAEGDRSLQPVPALLAQPEKLDPKLWRASCKTIAARLESLAGGSDPQTAEIIYSSAQQVASILRTNLTHEIHSRLDVEWPSG